MKRVLNIESYGILTMFIISSQSKLKTFSSLKEYLFTGRISDFLL